MFGVLSDYADLADKYNSGEINFAEFTELCKKRSRELAPKKDEVMTYINKHIISNE